MKVVPEAALCARPGFVTITTAFARRRSAAGHWHALLDWPKPDPL